MNPTELFETVYKKVMVQMERIGIRHPQLQDAAVSPPPPPPPPHPTWTFYKGWQDVKLG